ncbi:MAG: MFS transporter [Myxococcota bacterium]
MATNHLSSPSRPDGAPGPALDTRSILAVVTAGTFFFSVGISSIGLALPNICRDLAADVHLARWVMMALLMSSTTFLLIMGRMSDLFGHRRMYVAGNVVYSLAMLLSGLATDLPFLLVGRVLQGFGGAMVMAAGPAILSTLFPPSQRGRALGVMSTAVYAGLACGPPVGGFILTGFGWKWIFFSMVPVAAVVAVAGYTCIPSDAKAGKQQLDIRGMVLLAVGLPLLLLALNQGGVWGWGSPAILVPGAAGVICLTAFVMGELGAKSPVVDLTLFRSRLFTGSTLAALANYTALTCVTFLAPFFLNEGMRLDPSRAGIVLAAQPLIMALVAAPAGWLSDRIGSRGLTVGGMLVIAGVLLYMSRAISFNMSIAEIAVIMGLLGFGTGIFTSPNSSALMGSAPREHQGLAGGMMAFARNLGMVTGTLLAADIFRLMGGNTGRLWGDADLSAIRVVIYTAVVVALLGAFTSAMRGPYNNGQRRG